MGSLRYGNGRTPGIQKVHASRTRGGMGAQGKLTLNFKSKTYVEITSGL